MKQKVLAAFLALGLVFSAGNPRSAHAVAGIFTGGWVAVVVAALGVAVGGVFTGVGAGTSQRGFVVAGLAAIGFGILLLDADANGEVETLRFGPVSDALSQQLNLSAEDLSAYDDERFELNAWVEEAELFLSQGPGMGGDTARKILVERFNETGFQAGTVRVVRALLADASRK